MKLNKNMTVSQFDNGYWYVTDLKKFAKEIGIPNSSKLRKDELENLIKVYLNTGKVPKPTRKDIIPKGPKDSDVGLSEDLPVKHFANNPQTWNFLDSEAKKIDPNFQRVDGTKYRLNRWRDEQLTKGNPITYEDLAKAYVKINNSDEPRKRIQGTYYMYFLDDYMKNEPNANREEGIKAWHKLKKLDIPKTYKDWKNYQNKNAS